MRFHSPALIRIVMVLFGTGTLAPGAEAQSGLGHPVGHGATLPTFIVRKNPGCLCCDKWIAIAKADGFKVEMRESNDMVAIKQKAGVPLAQASCHTTTAGGYFFEGHVPLDLVRRVLETRPAIAGLLAPGMPPSVPGMEDGRPHQPYDVLVLSRDGKLTTYARR